MREALFYEKRDGKVVCRLCPHECVIKEGKTGLCRVRQSREGKLYTLNYGACSSCAVDPIEKKPLYHFYPGHTILSLGTWGCNFHCLFCQNWEISQGNPPTINLEPTQVLDMLRTQGSRCIGVAYTYSEPIVWYEFVLDTAKLVKEAGYKNVLVTNGFINEEPLYKLLPYVDAMNIDLKSFRDEFYRRLCRGRLEPVKRTIEQVYRRCHLEVTTLLVTGENTGEEEIEALASWLAGISPDIPLHLSRYFPNFEFTAPPTPLEDLYRARDIARRHLRYVYLGNVWIDEGGATYCPECRRPVIKREGYKIREVALKKEERGWFCASCSASLPIAGNIFVR
ncbi:Radical SAM domain protein [Ammonifex degensii KC4]|uniref:Radical SAM domain protein n=1 Tax=Ammonifex degensii (strain DSM 10501 / KC4) TaxID=429009 RepID=C9RAW3_AMMDK|nr:AmmeMemoRadiSam system radical SAM enzyme [Ammonifex degensii]ACX51390.1 Radical SAM domain protein [Ammonifex degensii KC4]